jgi:hypothetical protein
MIIRHTLIRFILRIIRIQFTIHGPCDVWKRMMEAHTYDLRQPIRMIGASVLPGKHTWVILVEIPKWSVIIFEHGSG